MMSRSKILPSFSSSRQMMMAWKVSGLRKPGDHGLAAGLDALGDGDFALAREKLDRAHLAQIHAHGIVGAVGGLGLGLALVDGGGRGDDARGGFGLSWLLPFGSSASSVSMTVMPMSENIDMVSWIWSEEIEKRHCDSTSSFTYGNLGVGWLVMRLMTKHCEVSLGAEINRLRSAGCIISEHCAV